MLLTTVGEDSSYVILTVLSSCSWKEQISKATENVMSISYVSSWNCRISLKKTTFYLLVLMCHLTAQQQPVKTKFTVYNQASAINNYFRAAGKMAGQAQLSSPTQSSPSPHITSPLSLVTLPVLESLPDFSNSNFINWLWKFFLLLLLLFSFAWFGIFSIILYLTHLPVCQFFDWLGD